MADQQGIISNRIIIDTTQATQAFQTLRKEMQELKVAHEKALRSDNKSTMFQGELRSVQELQKQIVALNDSLQKLRNQQSSNIASSMERTNVAANTKYFTDQEKASKAFSASLKQQMEARVKLENDTANLIGKQNAEASKQYWKDQDTLMKQRSSQLQGQMQAQQRLANEASKPYVNLQAQIRNAASEAERLWTIQNKSGKQSDTDAYNVQATKLRALKATQDEYNRSMGQSSTLLDGFQRRVRSHMEWMVSGALIMGAIGVPAAIVKTIADVDKAMASMKQVAPQLHHDVSEFNKETMKLIDIAATYGEKIENVAEAATLWGRMYGRIAGGMEIVNTLTRQSMVLTVADNMTLVEANKSVEAAMFQYGLVAKNSTEALAYSGRIIDVWTKLAHTGGVSANDLAQGVQRSGAVAKQTGVDFEFLNAMIATTVRATGRSGAEIGEFQLAA